VVRAYSERVARFTELAERLGARSRLVSNLRGLSFALSVVCVITAFTADESALWGSLGGVFGAVFLGLVVAHSRVIREEDMALRWVQVNKDAVTRNGSRFKELPETGERFSNALHPYADDLDVFGPASLFQRVCTARTQMGQQRLAAFLMNRAARDEVDARQQAAKELAPQLELRQELEALALAGHEGDTPRRGAKVSGYLDVEPLLAWAEAKPGLSNKPVLVALLWILPTISVAAIVGSWVRGWHPVAWIVPLIAQSILLLTARVHTQVVFNAVSASQGVFLRFGPMLRVLEQCQPKCERLQELQAETRGSAGEPPSHAMRQFERIVSWFELRHNGLVHPFVNSILMWDMHCVLRLEGWQRRYGSRLRHWFTALGELEALASLAALAHDNPDYAWPELRDGEVTFEAQGLGHPLLSATTRVTNDVDLMGAGRALLVTGSNMSGKSTLLRSIGVNAVLALAGAPVCAVALRLSPVAVRTSMRIRDSLDQGVSHFYAELRKVKGVLDSLDCGMPVLFLLDEILHGTNSRERQIGARWILAELLRKGAMGAVSTHDSGLCELPEPLMSRVTQVHLREVAEAGELKFDYKLHEGPVRSGNALRLMRSLGIEVPLTQQEAPGAGSV